MGDIATLPHIAEQKIWKRDPKDRELWLHVPSGVWYVRKKQKGKRALFKTTKQTTKGKARTVANRIIQEWSGSTTKEFEAMGITFGEHAKIALEDWLQSTKFRARYKKNLKLYVEELIKEIGYVRLVDINEGFIESWVEEFRGRRTDRVTFRDYVSYITKVMRHAKRNGIIKSAPDFENPDPPKSGGKAYTKAQMTCLFEVAKRKLDRARQGKNRQAYYRALCAMIQLRCCFNSIMRLRECICAPWDEIDLKTGRWVIPPERVKMGSRTGRGKDIYVDDKLILPLLLELKQLQVEVFGFEPKWLFPNPYDPSRPVFDNKSAWRRLKRDAGIDGKAEWHALRDTAMTWLLAGDDEFQKELQASCPECQARMKAEKLRNPLEVAWYSGTDVRTIQKNYVDIKPEHTRGVGSGIRL